MSNLRHLANMVQWTFLIILFFLALGYIFLILRIQWAGGPHGLSPVYRSMPEADYANFWAAGHLARQGSLDTLYSSDGFETVRQKMFGASIQRLDWIYPPTILLLAAPLSCLPLLPSYFLWLLLIFCLAVFVLRIAGLSWPVIFLGLAGPATWRAFQLGQIVPLTGSLVFAGLLLSRRRPGLGGIMLALASLKPQPGLLAPIALLATRNWSAILWATVSLLVLVVFTTIFFGLQSWLLFVQQAGDHGKTIIETFFPGGYPGFAGSVFWTARAWGAPIPLAYLIQTSAGVCAAATVWLFCRSSADEESKTIVTCCLSLLVSPYLFASDFIAYSTAVAVLMQRKGWLSVPLAFLWVWPGLSDAMTALDFKPMLPLCAICTAILANQNRPTPAWSPA